MRKGIILLAIILSPIFTQTISAQSTPMFELPLYFEDAVGNKDTVIIGYDTTANSNNWNQQFGEHAIVVPFDSVFEVRVAHSDLWPIQTGKKAIANWEVDINQSCGAAAPIKLFVHAKYFPLTIHYDSTLVHASDCRKQMIISPYELVFLLQNWWNADHYCMWDTNEIQDSSLYIIHPEWTSATEEFEVEGQGVHRLSCYFWTVFWGGGPCAYPVKTNDITSPRQSRSWPNPATDRIRLNLNSYQSVSEIALFDLLGRQVKTIRYPQGDLVPISELSAGSYIAIARYEGGRSESFRFVKEE